MPLLFHPRLRSLRWFEDCSRSRGHRLKDLGSCEEDQRASGEDAAEGTVASVAARPHGGVGVSRRIPHEAPEDFSQRQKHLGGSRRGEPSRCPPRSPNEKTGDML